MLLMTGRKYGHSSYFGFISNKTARKLRMSYFPSLSTARFSREITGKQNDVRFILRLQRDGSYRCKMLFSHRTWVFWALRMQHANRLSHLLRWSLRSPKMITTSVVRMFIKDHKHLCSTIGVPMPESSPNPSLNPVSIKSTLLFCRLSDSRHGRYENVVLQLTCLQYYSVANRCSQIAVDQWVMFQVMKVLTVEVSSPRHCSTEMERKRGRTISHQPTEWAKNEFFKVFLVNPWPLGPEGPVWELLNRRSWGLVESLVIQIDPPWFFQTRSHRSSFWAL